MIINVKDILQYLDSISIQYKFYGNIDSYIRSFAPLKQLKNDAMIWARNISYVDQPQLAKYNNLLLFIPVTDCIPSCCNCILTTDPYKAYFKVLANFWKAEDYEAFKVGISDTAIVKSKSIGRNVYIGENTFIDEDVIIGDNVMIQHNVTIQGHVKIGSNTLIQSGTTIGSSGFGYMVEDDGTRTCIPHLGGVTIGNNVRIGSMVCIQRGVLSDTVIEDYSRIDNMCHISHNDVIREGAMVVVGTVVAGSATIGKAAWLGPGTIVNDGVCIADKVYTGTGTVVNKDLPEQVVAVGIPARILRERDMQNDLD